MSNRAEYDALRAKARNQGLRVVTKAGGYMIVDPGNNTVLAGAWPNAYSMTADDVSDFLAEVN